MVSFSTQYCLAINPLERLLALRPETLKAVSGVFITAIIYLTLPVPIPDEKKKLTEIFIFTLLSGASKGFMKALKAI